MGNDVGIDLNLGNKLLHRHYEVVEELCFQRQYLVLSTQNFFLVFLQFLRDVTLCLR